MAAVGILAATHDFRNLSLQEFAEISPCSFTVSIPRDLNKLRMGEHTEELRKRGQRSKLLKPPDGTLRPEAATIGSDTEFQVIPKPLASDLNSHLAGTISWLFYGP